MVSIATWIVASALGIIGYAVIDMMHKRRVTSRGKLKLPYGPIRPFCGNAWLMMNTKSVTELHQQMSAYMPWSPAAGFWIMNKLYVLVNDPKLVEGILSKSWAARKDGDTYDVFRSLFDGVFAREGENWFKLRKPFMNLVHPKFVNCWMEIFLERAEKLCQAIATQQGPFEISSLVYTCVLDIICETHMGTKAVSDVKGVEFRFHEHLMKALDSSYKRMSSVAYRLGLSWLTRKSEEESKFESDFLKLPNHIVSERRKVLQRECFDVTSDEPTCYTDIIIKVGASEKANDVQISKMAVDLLAAGSHTTAVTISSTLLYLAMHPQYQEKVYEELCQVFEGSDREPTPEDLKNLVYMEMVINETLRHSGAAGLSRILDRDVELEGYHFPKGTAIYLRFMNICRDPQWWKKPLEFYPDHFLPSEIASRPSGAFTPFSGGARGCPGQLYAWVSMKAILSTVLRRFQFTTDLKFDETIYNYLLMQEPKCTRITAHARPSIEKSG